MTNLETTLDDIARRRAGFKDRRAKIDEELAARRAALLADELAQINDLIAKARAQGATLGDLKRAYGTKDHRTITSIVNSHAAEIAYWKDALTTGQYGQWFTITSATEDDIYDTVLIHDVVFSITEIENGIMLLTEQDRWNEDFTVENATVRDFDGKTEDEDERVAEIGDAWRKLRSND